MRAERESSERITRRELAPRCRHHECVCARAEELAAMGMVRLAVEIQVSDMPVRCRKSATPRDEEGS